MMMMMMMMMMMIMMMETGKKYGCYIFYHVIATFMETTLSYAYNVELHAFKDTMKAYFCDHHTRVDSTLLIMMMIETGKKDGCYIFYNMVAKYNLSYMHTTLSYMHITLSYIHLRIQ